MVLYNLIKTWKDLEKAQRGKNMRTWKDKSSEKIIKIWMGYQMLGVMIDDSLLCFSVTFCHQKNCSWRSKDASITLALDSFAMTTPIIILNNNGSLQNKSFYVDLHSKDYFWCRFPGQTKWRIRVMLHTTYQKQHHVYCYIIQKVNIKGQR